MKRTVCIILLMAMILSGCGVHGERIKEPVVFYYIRDAYEKDMSEIFDSEIREAAGHKNDLPYLLALYTMGPSKEDLRTPLPPGTMVTPTEHTAAGLVLALSDAAQAMTEAEFTLAAACLAMTVMEWSDIPSVTVTCEGRSILINADNLLLQDTGLSEPMGGK